MGSISDDQRAPFPLSILRMRAVEERTGFKRAWIYRMIKRGDFPSPVAIGRQARGWRSDEVDQWVRSRERVNLVREAAA